MVTLTEVPAELDPAALLDPSTLRFTALFAMSMGFTPDEVRTRSAGTRQEAAGHQLADEIDLMTLCGFTRQVASTVLDERDHVNHANRALHAEHDCAEEARQEILAVAEAMLRADGPAAVDVCRQIADTADKRGDARMRRSFTEFAEAAEQLLAECGAESFT